MTLAASQSQDKGTARRTRTTRPLTVAEYIDRQLDLCGKTQAEVAAEAGFNKANIITMLKKGQTKLPLSKVGPVARALGVDPKNLFRMVMAEYEPETWPDIEENVLSAPVISDNEYEIIRLVRKAGGANPAPRNAEQRKALIDLIASFADENA